MKLEVNINKKYAFLIFGAIILLVISVGVSATWDTSKKIFHSADDVKVTIPEEGDYSLQDAITGGLIGSSGVGEYTITRNDTVGSIGFHSFCAMAKVRNAEDSHYCDIYKNDSTSEWYIKQYKTGCTAVCIDFN